MFCWLIRYLSIKHNKIDVHIIIQFFFLGKILCDYDCPKLSDKISSCPSIPNQSSDNFGIPTIRTPIGTSTWDHAGWGEHRTFLTSGMPGELAPSWVKRPWLAWTTLGRSVRRRLVWSCSFSTHLPTRHGWQLNTWFLVCGKSTRPIEASTSCICSALSFFTKYFQ